jgi:hypothetical protein
MDDANDEDQINSIVSSNNLVVVYLKKKEICKSTRIDHVVG